MIHLTPWLLRGLLLCAGLYALWSALTILREGRSEEVIPVKRIDLVKTRIAELCMVVIAFTCGSMLGYLYRSHQLADSTVTYTSVLIKDKFSNEHFNIQPARMEPIDTTVCQSVVDWQEGETLCSLKYEQLYGCKRIIAYDRFNCMKGELNASK